MTEHTDEAEARRLIEEALGSNDDVSIVVARARKAAAAFRTAADAMEHGDPHAAALAMHQHVDGSEYPPRAAYDLCAAGAVSIAKLIREAGPCECGDEDCAVMEIEAHGDVQPMQELAVMAINAACGGELALLNEVLDRVYRSHDGMAIYEMSTTLVHMRAEIRRMITGAS